MVKKLLLDLNRHIHPTQSDTNRRYVKGRDTVYSQLSAWVIRETLQKNLYSIVARSALLHCGRVIILQSLSLNKYNSFLANGP